MEVPGPLDAASQGSIGCNTFDFTSEQLCELETIYCRGQFQEDDATMLRVLALLEACPEDFGGIPAHVIKAWFMDRRPASAAGAPRTAQLPQQAPAVTAGTQQDEPDYDTAPPQSQVQSVRRHNAQQFGRDKAALFAQMEGYYRKQPGANILVLTTSPASLGMWADGRGPLLNADSVLQDITQYAADALKQAAEQRVKGTLDFNSNPRQRFKRETKCKGSGYLHFQAAIREAEREKILAAGQQIKKGMVEQQCALQWRELRLEERQEYHRASAQRDALTELQPEPVTQALQGPSDHQQCGWEHGPRGCYGNHAASALLPCKGDSAWTQVASSTCPAGRLVSLECAARNLLDGQPRQLCLACAEDHSIELKGCSQPVVLEGPAEYGINEGASSSAVHAEEQPAFIQRLLSDGTPSLSSILASGQHLGGAVVPRRRIRQHARLAAVRPAARSVAPPPAIAPSRLAVGSGVATGSRLAAGSLQPSANRTMAPGQQPTSMAGLAAHVQDRLREAGLIPAQSQAGAGSAGHVQPVITTDRGPQAPAAPALILVDAPERPCEETVSRGADASDDADEDDDTIPCSWAAAPGGCMPGMGPPGKCISSTCGNSVHHVCPPRSIANCDDLPINLIQKCYPCSCADAAIVMTAGAPLAGQAQGPDRDTGQASPPKRACSVSLQSCGGRKHAAAPGNMSPVRKSARVRAGVGRPQRLRGQ